jgi:hypothetical protein
MSLIKLTAYHSQSYQVPHLAFPSVARGFDLWLGDGYYFWQDEYFAKWWGENKKTTKTQQRYTIYKADLTFKDDDFIDTVFNEEDYYNFCLNIEKFARKCQKNLGRKPSLEEFNEFLEDYKLWQNIDVIRFQDVPENDEHIEVTGFYYKKRIQIRVRNPKIITNFALYKNMARV